MRVAPDANPAPHYDHRMVECEERVMERRHWFTGIAGLIVVALFVAACGGDDDDTSTSAAAAPPTSAVASAPASEATADEETEAFSTEATATAAAGEGATVEVTMGKPTEYAMVPVPAEVAAGTVTFDVANQGTIVHEMVVVRTDKGAANLAAGDEADETGAVDEVPDLPAGESKPLTVTLEPGAYALVCNLPGHYAQGMYADFVVK